MLKRILLFPFSELMRETGRDGNNFLFRFRLTTSFGGFFLGNEPFIRNS